MESKIVYLDELKYKPLLFVNSRVLPYETSDDLEFYSKVKTIRRDVREVLKRMYKSYDTDYLAIIFETNGEPLYMFRNEDPETEEVLVYNIKYTNVSRIYHAPCPYAKYGYLSLAVLGLYGLYRYWY